MDCPRGPVQGGRHLCSGCLLPAWTGLLSPSPLKHLLEKTLPGSFDLGQYNGEGRTSFPILQLPTGKNNELTLTWRHLSMKSPLAAPSWLSQRPGWPTGCVRIQLPDPRRLQHRADLPGSTQTSCSGGENTHTLVYCRAGLKKAPKGSVLSNSAFALGAKMEGERFPKGFIKPPPLSQGCACTPYPLL